MSSIDSHDAPRESRRQRLRSERGKAVGKTVGKTSGKVVRKCSAFVIIFCILIVILFILGVGLAFTAIYTSTLSKLETDDLMTYEYQYHMRHLMWATGAGGILAALIGILGFVAINPKAATPFLRAMFELLLLLTAALLLILGMLVLSAMYIRRDVVDRYLRPLMTAYHHVLFTDPYEPLHIFQGEFQCCGLSNPPDPYSHLAGSPKGPLPWSCCLNYTVKDVDLYSTFYETQTMALIINDEGCVRNATAPYSAHSMYCDRISPELTDWAFASSIEALAVSLYCILLMIISCIAKRVEYDSFRGG